MIFQQTVSINEYQPVAGQTGAVRGGENTGRVSRRVDPYCEDYDTQIEAERRDLVQVVVLGYN